jgi:xylulokinase
MVVGVPDLLLTIDQGTTLTKVVAFGPDGRVEALSSTETPVSYPGPGLAESDAGARWTGVTTCVRDLLTRVAPERIGVVAVCGFMHTLTPVDGRGEPLHPTVLWADQRSAPQVQTLAAHAADIARRSGAPLTTMSSLPRMLWLRKEFPDLVDRAFSFLLPKDLVRYRLTGVLATDRWDAVGTGLVDIGTGSWSAELLDLVDLSPERMPPILRPDEPAGTITRHAAAQTGLREGTPVLVGTADWPATLIGSGTHLPEHTCLYLGSAGILGSFASAEALDTLGQTVYFGSTTSTGTALRWIRDVLSGPGDARPLTYAQLCREAATSVPGARGVTFHPHLLGERGGEMRPDARGALLGLSLAHDRSDILRAVIEGTVLWLRAVTDAYGSAESMGSLIAYGGAVQDPLWRQVTAAVYQRPLLIPRVTEGAALGLAKLGAVGTGIASGYRDLSREWTDIAAVEEPSRDMLEIYAEIYDRYRRSEAVLAALDELYSPSTVPSATTTRTG